MARYYTTDSLIRNVAMRCSLPITQNTFLERDFLEFANEEMDLGIVPLILSFHQDYLMVPDMVVLNSNQSRYPIPSRAIGNKLRDVFYVDNSGTSYELTRISVEDIPYFQYGSMGAITNPLRAFYMEGNELVLLPNSDYDVPQGHLRFHYYRRPNQMVSESRTAKITSVDFNKGILKIDQIPDAFSSDSLFDITSSKSPFNLLAVDLVPSDFPTTTNLTFTFGTPKIMTNTVPAKASIATGSYMFFTDSTNVVPVTYAFWMDLTGSDTQPVIAGQSPVFVRVDLSAAVTASDVAAAIAIEIDANISAVLLTSVLADVITVQGAGQSLCVGDNFNIGIFGQITTVQLGTNYMPTLIRKGDIYALAEETIIPQIPVELQSMLSQRVAIRCLESLGDAAGLQAAVLKLQEMESKSGSILQDRVEGAAQKVTNRHSFLNTTKRYIRR